MIACPGPVYFADQGIEVCEECGCLCCDAVDKETDHSDARYLCWFDSAGDCVLKGNMKTHVCEEEQDGATIQATDRDHDRERDQ